jgi:hypothetical protein
MGLLLEAMDVAGASRWRWLLSDEETGNPVADHMVDLDLASVEVGRFADLHGYVDSYAAPDRRARDEARFVAAAGEWAGRELLGPAIGAAIVAASPVTVRVKVPAALDAVLLWPLELAHADGQPLAARGDVTLVYDVAPDVTRATQDRGRHDLARAGGVLSAASAPCSPPWDPTPAPCRTPSPRSSAPPQTCPPAKTGPISPPTYSSGNR